MPVPAYVARHSAPVPRYTSYPTANHFSGAVGADAYRGWLQDLPRQARLSLYLHIPYCRELCWYCGCSTKATRRYEPVRTNLFALEAEIATVAGLVPADHVVEHIHWGGGSPDILEPGDIATLADRVRTTFHIADTAEFAVEIDPRLLNPRKIAAFAAAGVNRASIGVQDFDCAVQAAIGRRQSFNETQAAVDGLRAAGISSINLDLVYGLPHQTLASLETTLDHVLSLAPDRLAVFGYAHLPSRLKHQRLIDEAALPGIEARFEQACHLAERLTGAGYVDVGLDHFARPTDTLVTGRIARNFQGYTTDQADALIGFGASAVSKLPQGYAQNAPGVAEYGARIADAGLATVRGHALSQDDAVRAAAIEALMCNFVFDAETLSAVFGRAAVAPLVAIADRIVSDDRDQFTKATRSGFAVTARGRPFLRIIAARFDAYLAPVASDRRHAPAI